MNELIIRKRWKYDICCYVIGIIGLIWGRIYVPEYRYSFAAIPLIIGAIICLIFTIKERHEEIVFGKFGITLPDGTLCKWENIKLIEFRRTSFFSLSLLIHTKNHTYEKDTNGYDFKFKRLKGYMMLNHPDIPCDSYVIEVLDGGYDTKKKRDVKVDDYVYEELERRRNKRKPKKGSSLPS